MYTALQIAAYIMSKYPSIDEMRLHKYLYFAQRESFIVNNKPLFEDTFEAWKFGPVIPEVRHAYHAQAVSDSLADSYDIDTRQLVDSVISRYESVSSWGLSTITHREQSWNNARVGIPVGENGNEPMKMSDIQSDAEHEKLERGAEFMRRVAFYGQEHKM